MPAPPVAPDSPAVWRETVTRVRRQSLADFHALPEGTLAQFFDGEVLMSPAPLFLHQRVVARLHVALARFVEDHGLGEVLAAPLDVTLSDTLVVQPDLVFISHARGGIVTRRGLSGAPDLVAEVLSPSTAYYDLTLKRDAYLAHGVDEYWIVDPERETVAVLACEDGRYRTHADLRGAGRAASALLDGFGVEVADLFGDRPARGSPRVSFRATAAPPAVPGRGGRSCDGVEPTRATGFHPTRSAWGGAARAESARQTGGGHRTGSADPRLGLSSP